jgi:alkylation response protein AidB-like acyl-CoA dehydrogenase
MVTRPAPIASRPRPETLRFPQIGRLDMPPDWGGHTSYPVLGVPISDHILNVNGRVRDFVLLVSESLRNECQEFRQLTFLVDITTPSKPYTVSTFEVPEQPGDFCRRGGRFGPHSSHESFAPIYYRKLVFLAYFNAGVRAVDIRNPFAPREVAFFIPAVTPATAKRCVKIDAAERCKVAIQTNNVEVGRPRPHLSRGSRRHGPSHRRADGRRPGHRRVRSGSWTSKSRTPTSNSAFAERSAPGSKPTCRRGSRARPCPKRTASARYRELRAFGRKLGARGGSTRARPRHTAAAGWTSTTASSSRKRPTASGSRCRRTTTAAGRLGSATILVWGTEEQKRAFLPPIYTGEVRTWQLLTEPGAGSDLAGVSTTAIRDGDEYVINGQKIFVGSDHGADRIWMIAVTNPAAKRHENVSWFMIDANLPGITVQPMELMGTGGEGGTDPRIKNTVFFDNVRVPASTLVGGENNGWKAATTHLELEHGAGGRIGRHRVWDRLLRYCQETKREGAPLTQDADTRDLLADIYIKTRSCACSGCATSGRPTPSGRARTKARSSPTTAR